MDSHRIKRVVFLSGGVLIPRLSEITLALYSSESSDNQTLSRELLTVEQQLSIGKISGEDFSNRISELFNLAIDSEAFLVQAKPLIHILPGMWKVLLALRDEFELVLVSDYPDGWLEYLLQDIDQPYWFKDQNTFFLPELKPPDQQRRMLQTLVEAGAIISGSSLWIDHHPKRTMNAIRMGIYAGIFVSGDRLYRDLWLWSMVDLAGCRKSSL